jgi:glycosyltransferase involved in cell wall biosynthesis
MVVTLTAFASLLKDLGLSTAAIQRAEIRHEQVSDLFWVNGAAGAAPLLTLFCNELRLQAMQESAMFLLPSHMDTGPTALKEALAMGLWPVCYDNSGPAELIRRFQFGSLMQT